MKETFTSFVRNGKETVDYNRIVGIALIGLLVVLAIVNKLFSEPVIALTSEQEQFVCRASTAANMGHPIGLMSSFLSEGKILVSYTRPSDNTAWAVYCWTEGDRVLWKTVNGRVRDSQWDEVIRYSFGESHAKITITHPDGSGSSRAYKIPAKSIVPNS